MTGVVDTQSSNKADENRDMAHIFEYHLSRIRAMNEKIEFKPTLPVKRKGILAVLYWLPEFTGFGRNVTGTATLLTRWGQIKGTFEHAINTAKSLLNSFMYSGFALAIVDFIRVPVIYLAAWQLGESAHVTATKNVRLFYAGLSLGLSVTALAIPVAAPPIAIISATLGVLVSIISLAKFFYRRHQVAKELVQKNVELDDLKNEFALLQKESAEKELSLQAAISQNDCEHINQLFGAVDELQLRFDEKKGKLQALYDQQYKLEQKQSKRGMSLFFDKVLGVSLSSSALIGVTVSLFFPPTGLAILAVSAGLGTLYIIGRMTYPVFQGLFQWVSSHQMKSSSANDGTAEPSEPNVHIQSLSATDTGSNIEESSAAPQHFPPLFSTPDVRSVKETVVVDANRPLTPFNSSCL